MAMARLAQPGLSTTARRYQTTPWRAWYSLDRWKRLRDEVLTRALFTCSICGRIEADTSRLVADHVIPHRGDPALFWDPANLQCLCKACHDSVKQRIERAPQRR
jgi:5-methylcytosine-specific restriction endonuclease McrA